MYGAVSFRLKRNAHLLTCLYADLFHVDRLRELDLEADMIYGLRLPGCADQIMVYLVRVIQMVAAGVIDVGVSVCRLSVGVFVRIAYLHAESPGLRFSRIRLVREQFEVPDMYCVFRLLPVSVELCRKRDVDIDAVARLGEFDLYRLRDLICIVLIDDHADIIVPYDEIILGKTADRCSQAQHQRRRHHGCEPCRFSQSGSFHLSPPLSLMMTPVLL